jgi:transposase
MLGAGRRCRLYFQTKDGSYNTSSLITCLRNLKKHFRGRRLILVWDRLNAHRSAAMKTYLARQSWLSVEYLPPYAPDLNPIEPVWGNVKGQELANLPVEDTFDVVSELHRGLRRVRRCELGHAFLAHAGLSL